MFGRSLAEPQVALGKGEGGVGVARGMLGIFWGGGAGGGGFGVWVVLAGFPWGSSWICSTWRADNAPQECSGLRAGMQIGRREIRCCPPFKREHRQSFPKLGFAQAHRDPSFPQSCDSLKPAVSPSLSTLLIPASEGGTERNESDKKLL